MSVLVQTSFGDIVIDLDTNKFPNATYNFLKLCKLKHYNNALFMKVQKDFVTEIVTEKPTTIWQKMGEDRPFFRDEVDLEAKVNNVGLVGTSNKGPNLNNSEFFITLTKAHLTSLNGKHTVFGRVEEGLEILKKINQTYTDQKVRPQMNIRILHTFVLDDPFKDPEGLQEPPSPPLVKDHDRLQAIQHLQMLQKYATQNDIIQATKKQKAKKQAITLQMLGQLPDENIKPPENVLFVCKLNPITQQRDLQIIFSRFGPIKSVEIVRDWKTGQSLQYGFIEFESEKSCEEAYLKMNNVLIDERRIQVDFSQSVSKLMPRNKSNQQRFIKSGESKEKSNVLVSRARATKNYYGETKYDIVAKDTSKVYNRSNDEVPQPSRNERPEKLTEESRNRDKSRSEEAVKQKSQEKQGKPKKQSPVKRTRKSSSASKQRRQKKSKKDKKIKKDKKSKKDRKDKKSRRQRSSSSSSSSSSRSRRSRDKKKHKN